MNTIRNNSASVTFNAKFLNSEALHEVVDYAISHGKYKKLDIARQNIEMSMLKTRLHMTIDSYNGMPMVTFYRFDPKHSVSFPKNFERDYNLIRQVEYVSKKEKNPLKFAYNLIVKMGRNVPKNKIFKEVVANNAERKKFVHIG